MQNRLPEAGRNRILEISEQLFTEFGYSAVSIRDISSACDLTKAALYYHFPSKEALYFEVIEQYAARLRRKMSQAGAQEGTTRDRLVAILLEYVRLAANRRSPLFMLRRDRAALSANRPVGEHERIVHAMLQPLSDALDSAVKRGELRIIPTSYSPAAILIGMVHGLMHHRSTFGQAGLSEEDIIQIVDIFLYGCANPGPLVQADGQVAGSGGEL